MTEGFSQEFPMPPAPGQPTTAVPRRRPLLARPVAVGLIGVLVGAFLVGVPWLTLSLFGDAPGGRPLEAPGTLGGYESTQVAVGKLGSAGTAGKAQIERADKTDRENAARVSEAYDGAPAASRSYSDARLTNGFQLTAVRAPSPELFAPYEDATALGLAAPSTELVRVGAVQCLRHNDPTPLGREPDPDSSFVTACQRSGPALTVLLRITAREDTPTAERLAAAVEEAWTTLGR
ncbi:hypothetical protein [Amycolatopsis sp. NPDC098790]|uniref:hypothetical protein n=1 Tax=Amycolatopsis sp. NPDC098790 TaxID=3363939 RepID=UPI00382B2B94